MTFELNEMVQWKHCTHVIECVVGSNKVVSAHEAHVEIPKVERFRMREGRKGERLASAWRPKDGPIMPQCGRALVYFRIPPNTCLTFFNSLLTRETKPDLKA